MENTHQYEVNLQWNSEQKGTLSSPVLPSKIEVATPPEFPKGMPGIWSPEHLFVAAVNSCVMTTFLAIAENSKVEFKSYECKAIGKVEQVEGKFKVTQVILKPKLTVSSSFREDRMKRILEKSEKACLISNSISSEILFQPTVILS